MSDAQIHPTAIVDAQAEIGAGTIIGPYCIVAAGVVLGPDCWLQHHVTLCGPMTAGARNKFYAYCSIGQQTQDLKYQGEPTYLEIGDENSFREFVTVNRSTTASGKTRIGNGGHFLAYSHIGHDCTVGDAVVFSNNGTLAGHVQVGDHAIMGGLTAVHQFCRIGRYAITGGCSKIVQDIPPFMIADGNPAKVRGINLVGFGAERISARKRQVDQGSVSPDLPLQVQHPPGDRSDPEGTADERRDNADHRVHRKNRARHHSLTPPLYLFGGGVDEAERKSFSIFRSNVVIGASVTTLKTLRTSSSARFDLRCLASTSTSSRTTRTRSSRFV